MLVYFMPIWNVLRPFGTYISWPFGIFYDYLAYFMAIWYILWSFGLFYGHLLYLRPFGNLEVYY
jgi:hypothetical protein